MSEELQEVVEGSSVPDSEVSLPSEEQTFSDLLSVFEGEEPQGNDSAKETTIEPPLEEVVIDGPPQEEKKVPTGEEPPTEEKPQGIVTPSAETDTPTTATYPEWYDKQTKSLEEGYYRLPEEVADRIDPDLVTVLPGLAARVHMSVMQSTLVAVMNGLPTYLQQLEEQRNTHTQLENQFFEAWPQLEAKKGELQTEIIQAIHAVKQVQPKATLKDVISLAGAMVSTKHKLVGGGAVTPPPAKKAVPPNPAAARTSPRTGLVPGKELEESNPFAIMAEELDL